MGSPKSPNPVDDSGSKLDHGPDISLNMDLVLDKSDSNIVTLEPFSPTPSGSNNSRKPRFRKSRNYLDSNNHEITPGNFEHSNYSKFLILKMKNGQKMREFDMFGLYREIFGECQHEPKITFLNDGNLLVEVSSLDDSTKILSIPSLSGLHYQHMS